MTQNTATHTYTCSKLIPWIADNQGERVRLAIDQTNTCQLIVTMPDGVFRYVRSCATLGEAYKLYLSMDVADEDILTNNEFWQVRR
jgi:hypothetical protein